MSNGNHLNHQPTAEPAITVKSQRKAIASYVIGFISSIILTFVAYTLVANRVLSGWSLAYALLGLGLVQLVFQLVCFLHLGQEREPRWKLLVFDFTLLVLVIVVFGSLWIMGHLNYHMMLPSNTDTYMREHEGL